MANNLESTSAKSKQGDFWKSIINKYEDRNAHLEYDLQQLRQRVDQMDASVPAVVTYNMAKLARESEGADINEIMDPICVCSADEPTSTPLKLPDMTNMSVFSIESADLCYMDKIKELTEREKNLIAEVNKLKSKQKGLKDVQKRVDALSGTKGGEGVTVRGQDLGGMSESLVKENQRLCDELADCKLELKHLRENVEGPIQRELERERRKNAELEDSLRRKDKDCEEKHAGTIREAELMKKQLQANVENIKNLLDINGKFKEEIMFLANRNEQLQNDLINQKLSEATTLAAMRNELTKKRKRRSPSTKSSYCTCLDSDSSGGGPPDDKSRPPPPPPPVEVQTETPKKQPVQPPPAPPPPAPPSPPPSPPPVDAAQQVDDVPVRGPKQESSNLNSLARDLSKEIEEAKADKDIPKTLIDTASNIKDLCDIFDKKCLCNVPPCAESKSGEKDPGPSKSAEAGRDSRVSFAPCDEVVQPKESNLSRCDDNTCPELSASPTGSCNDETCKAHKKEFKDMECICELSSDLGCEDSVCICDWPGECETTNPSQTSKESSCDCGEPGSCLSECEQSKQPTVPDQTLCKSVSSGIKSCLPSCGNKSNESSPGAVQTFSDGKNVTTTVVNTGYLEVSTVGERGTISTSVTVNDKGNIEVVTDVIPRETEVKSSGIVIEDYHSKGGEGEDGSNPSTKPKDDKDTVCKNEPCPSGCEELYGKLSKIQENQNDAAGDFELTDKYLKQMDLSVLTNYLSELGSQSSFDYISKSNITVAYMLNQKSSNDKNIESVRDSPLPGPSRPANVSSVPNTNNNSAVRILQDSRSVPEIIYVDECAVGTSDDSPRNPDTRSLAHHSSLTCDKLAVILEVDEHLNTSVPIESSNAIPQITSVPKPSVSNPVFSDASERARRRVCPYHSTSTLLNVTKKDTNIVPRHEVAKPVEPDNLVKPNKSSFSNLQFKQVIRPGQDSAVCPYHGERHSNHSNTQDVERFVTTQNNLAGLLAQLAAGRIFAITDRVLLPYLQGNKACPINGNENNINQSGSESGVSEYQTCINRESSCGLQGECSSCTIRQTCSIDERFSSRECFRSVSPPKLDKTKYMSAKTDGSQNTGPVSIGDTKDLPTVIRKQSMNSLEQTSVYTKSAYEEGIIDFSRSSQIVMVPPSLIKTPTLKDEDDRSKYKMQGDIINYTKLGVTNISPEYTHAICQNVTCYAYDKETTQDKTPQRSSKSSECNCKKKQKSSESVQRTSNTGPPAIQASQSGCDPICKNKVIIVKPTVQQGGDSSKICISACKANCSKTKIRTSEVGKNGSKLDKKINSGNTGKPSNCQCSNNGSVSKNGNGKKGTPCFPSCRGPCSQGGKNNSVPNATKKAETQACLSSYRGQCSGPSSAGEQSGGCRNGCKAVCSKSNSDDGNIQNKNMKPKSPRGSESRQIQSDLKVSSDFSLYIAECPGKCALTANANANPKEEAECASKCVGIYAKNKKIQNNQKTTDSGSSCNIECKALCAVVATQSDRRRFSNGDDRRTSVSKNARNQETQNKPKMVAAKSGGPNSDGDCSDTSSDEDCITMCNGVCAKNKNIQNDPEMLTAGTSSCPDSCTGICAKGGRQSSADSDIIFECNEECKGRCSKVNKKTKKVNKTGGDKYGRPSLEMYSCGPNCSGICANNSGKGLSESDTCGPDCSGICAKNTGKFSSESGTCGPDCAGICAQNAGKGSSGPGSSGACGPVCAGVCSGGPRSSTASGGPKASAASGEPRAARTSEGPRAAGSSGRPRASGASGILRSSGASGGPKGTGPSGDPKDTEAPGCSGAEDEQEPNKTRVVGVCEPLCTATCSREAKQHLTEAPTEDQNVNTDTCETICAGICTDRNGGDNKSEVTSCHISEEQSKSAANDPIETPVKNRNTNTSKDKHERDKNKRCAAIDNMVAKLCKCYRSLAPLTDKKDPGDNKSDSSGSCGDAMTDTDSAEYVPRGSKSSKQSDEQYKGYQDGTKNSTSNKRNSGGKRRGSFDKNYGGNKRNFREKRPETADMDDDNKRKSDGQRLESEELDCTNYIRSSDERRRSEKDYDYKRSSAEQRPKTCDKTCTASCSLVAKAAQTPGIINQELKCDIPCSGLCSTQTQNVPSSSFQNYCLGVTGASPEYISEPWCWIYDRQNHPWNYDSRTQTPQRSTHTSLNETNRRVPSTRMKQYASLKKTDINNVKKLLRNTVERETCYDTGLISTNVRTQTKNIPGKSKELQTRVSVRKHEAYIPCDSSTGDNSLLLHALPKERACDPIFEEVNPLLQRSDTAELVSRAALNILKFVALSKKNRNHSNSTLAITKYIEGQMSSRDGHEKACDPVFHEANARIQTMERKRNFSKGELEYETYANLGRASIERDPVFVETNTRIHSMERQNKQLTKGLLDFEKYTSLGKANTYTSYNSMPVRNFIVNRFETEQKPPCICKGNVRTQTEQTHDNRTPCLCGDKVDKNEAQSGQIQCEFKTSFTSVESVEVTSGNNSIKKITTTSTVEKKTIQVIMPATGANGTREAITELNRCDVPSNGVSDNRAQPPISIIIQYPAAGGQSGVAAAKPVVNQICGASNQVFTDTAVGSQKSDGTKLDSSGNKNRTAKCDCPDIFALLERVRREFNTTQKLLREELLVAASEVPTDTSAEFPIGMCVNKLCPSLQNKKPSQLVKTMALDSEVHDKGVQGKDYSKMSDDRVNPDINDIKNNKGTFNKTDNKYCICEYTLETKTVEETKYDSCICRNENLDRAMKTKALARNQSSKRVCMEVDKKEKNGKIGKLHSSDCSCIDCLFKCDQISDSCIKDISKMKCTCKKNGICDKCRAIGEELKQKKKESASCCVCPKTAACQEKQSKGPAKSYPRVNQPRDDKKSVKHESVKSYPCACKYVDKSKEGAELKARTPKKVQKERQSEAGKCTCGDGCKGKQKREKIEKPKSKPIKKVGAKCNCNDVIELLTENFKGSCTEIFHSPCVKMSQRQDIYGEANGRKRPNKPRPRGACNCSNVLEALTENFKGSCTEIVHSTCVKMNPLDLSDTQGEDNKNDDNQKTADNPVEVCNCSDVFQTLLKSFNESCTDIVHCECVQMRPPPSTKNNNKNRSAIEVCRCCDGEKCNCKAVLNALMKQTDLSCTDIRKMSQGKTDDEDDDEPDDDMCTCFSALEKQSKSSCEVFKDYQEMMTKSKKSKGNNGDKKIEGTCGCVEQLEQFLIQLKELEAEELDFRGPNKSGVVCEKKACLCTEEAEKLFNELMELQLEESTFNAGKRTSSISDKPRDNVSDKKDTEISCTCNNDVSKLLIELKELEEKENKYRAAKRNVVPETKNVPKRSSTQESKSSVPKKTSAQESKTHASKRTSKSNSPRQSKQDSQKQSREVSFSKTPPETPPNTARSLSITKDCATCDACLEAEAEYQVCQPCKDIPHPDSVCSSCQACIDIAGQTETDSCSKCQAYLNDELTQEGTKECNVCPPCQEDTKPDKSQPSKEDTTKPGIQQSCEEETTAKLCSNCQACIDAAGGPKSEPCRDQATSAAGIAFEPKDATTSKAPSASSLASQGGLQCQACKELNAGINRASQRKLCTRCKACKDEATSKVASEFEAKIDLDCQACKELNAGKLDSVSVPKICSKCKACRDEAASKAGSILAPKGSEVCEACKRLNAGRVRASQQALCTKCKACKDEAASKASSVGAPKEICEACKKLNESKAVSPSERKLCTKCKAYRDEAASKASGEVVAKEICQACKKLNEGKIVSPSERKLCTKCQPCRDEAASKTSSEVIQKERVSPSERKLCAKCKACINEAASKASSVVAPKELCQACKKLNEGKVVSPSDRKLCTKCKACQDEAASKAGSAPQRNFCTKCKACIDEGASKASSAVGSTTTLTTEPTTMESSTSTTSTSTSATTSGTSDTSTDFSVHYTPLPKVPSSICKDCLACAVPTTVSASEASAVSEVPASIEEEEGAGDTKVEEADVTTIETVSEVPTREATPVRSPSVVASAKEPSERIQTPSAATTVEAPESVSSKAPESTLHESPPTTLPPSIHSPSHHSVPTEASVHSPPYYTWTPPESVITPATSHHSEPIKEITPPPSHHSQSINQSHYSAPISEHSAPPTVASEHKSPPPSTPEPEVVASVHEPSYHLIKTPSEHKSEPKSEHKPEVFESFHTVHEQIDEIEAPPPPNPEQVEEKHEPAPVETKPEPEESKSEPEEAKPEPVEAKTEPVEEKPEQVEVEPEPIKTEPEPVEPEPEPVEAEPEPVKAEPEPVEAEPEPIEAEPKPVEAEPEPVEAEPEPVEAEPEPVEAEPEPVKAEPEPIEAEPEPIEAEPKPVEAEPEPVEAEPEPVEAEPEPVEEKPEPVEAKSEPEPVEVPPEPETVEAELEPEPEPEPEPKPEEEHEPEPEPEAEPEPEPEVEVEKEPEPEPEPEPVQEEVCPPIEVCKCDACVGTDHLFDEIDLDKFIPFETVPVLIGRIVLVPGETMEEVQQTVTDLKTLLQKARDNDISMMSIKTAEQQRVFIKADQTPSKINLKDKFNENLHNIDIEDLPWDKIKTTDSIYAIFLPRDIAFQVDIPKEEDEICNECKPCLEPETCHLEKEESIFKEAEEVLPEEICDICLPCPVDSKICHQEKVVEEEKEKEEEEEDEEKEEEEEDQGPCDVCLPCDEEPDVCLQVDLPSLIKSLCNICCGQTLSPKHFNIIRAYIDYMIIQESNNPRGVLANIDRDALLWSISNLQDFRDLLNSNRTEALNYGEGEECLSECNLEEITEMIKRQTQFLPIQLAEKFILEDKLINNIKAKGALTGDPECHKNVCQVILKTIMSSQEDKWNETDDEDIDLPNLIQAICETCCKKRIGLLHCKIVQAYIDFVLIEYSRRSDGVLAGINPNALFRNLQNLNNFKEIVHFDFDYESLTYGENEPCLFEYHYEAIRETIMRTTQYLPISYKDKFDLEEKIFARITSKGQFTGDQKCHKTVCREMVEEMFKKTICDVCEPCPETEEVCHTDVCDECEPCPEIYEVCHLEICDACVSCPVTDEVCHADICTQCDPCPVTAEVCHPDVCDICEPCPETVEICHGTVCAACQTCDPIECDKLKRTIVICEKFVKKSEPKFVKCTKTKSSIDKTGWICDCDAGCKCKACPFIIPGDKTGKICSCKGKCKCIKCDFLDSSGRKEHTGDDGDDGRGGHDGQDGNNDDFHSAHSRMSNEATMEECLKQCRDMITQTRNSRHKDKDKDKDKDKSRKNKQSINECLEICQREFNKDYNAKDSSGGKRRSKDHTNNDNGGSKPSSGNGGSKSSKHGGSVQKRPGDADDKYGCDNTDCPRGKGREKGKPPPDEIGQSHGEVPSAVKDEHVEQEQEVPKSDEGDFEEQVEKEISSNIYEPVGGDNIVPEGAKKGGKDEKEEVKDVVATIKEIAEEAKVETIEEDNIVQQGDAKVAEILDEIEVGKVEVKKDVKVEEERPQEIQEKNKEEHFEHAPEPIDEKISKDEPVETEGLGGEKAVKRDEGPQEDIHPVVHAPVAEQEVTDDGKVAEIEKEEELESIQEDAKADIESDIIVKHVDDEKGKVVDEKTSDAEDERELEEFPESCPGFEEVITEKTSDKMKSDSFPDAKPDEIKESVTDIPQYSIPEEKLESDEKEEFMSCHDICQVCPVPQHVKGKRICPTCSQPIPEGLEMCQTCMNKKSSAKWDEIKESDTNIPQDSIPQEKLESDDKEELMSCHDICQVCPVLQQVKGKIMCPTCSQPIPEGLDMCQTCMDKEPTAKPAEIKESDTNISKYSIPKEKLESDDKEEFISCHDICQVCPVPQTNEGKRVCPTCTQPLPEGLEMCQTCMDRKPIAKSVEIEESVSEDRVCDEDTCPVLDIFPTTDEQNVNISELSTETPVITIQLEPSTSDHGKFEETLIEKPSTDKLESDGKSTSEQEAEPAEQSEIVQPPESALEPIEEPEIVQVVKDEPVVEQAVKQEVPEKVSGSSKLSEPAPTKEVLKVETKQEPQREPEPTPAPAAEHKIAPEPSHEPLPSAIVEPAKKPSPRPDTETASTPPTEVPHQPPPKSANESASRLAGMEPSHEPQPVSLPEPAITPAPELVAKPIEEPKDESILEEQSSEHVSDEMDMLDEECLKLCKLCIELGGSNISEISSASGHGDQDLEECLKICKACLKRIEGDSCCECERSEIKIGPIYEKHGEEFENTLSALDLALKMYEQKSRAKDKMIDIMKAQIEVNGPVDYRNKFEKFKRCQDHNHSSLIEKLVNPISLGDFDELAKNDGYCICETQNISDCDCQKDETILAITDIRRIGVASVLIKWTGPVRSDITGYAIYINGTLKNRIFNPVRRMAVIDTINFDDNLEIEVYAVSPTGDTLAAVAYYNL